MDWPCPFIEGPCSGSQGLKEASCNGLPSMENKTQETSLCDRNRRQDTGIETRRVNRKQVTVIKTLPKAQRTRGLSSYHKLLHKS